MTNGATKPLAPAGETPATSAPEPQSDAERQAAELAVLFPGRKVKIEDGLEITVMPMLVHHMREFSEPIVKAIDGLVASGVDFNALGESWPKLVKHLQPLLLHDLFDLLNLCADVELDDVPHWVLPIVAGEWIEENFGTAEKVRPWFEVVSKVVGKLGNQDIDLWATVSKSLSRPDTAKDQS